MIYIAQITYHQVKLFLQTVRLSVVPHRSMEIRTRRIALPSTLEALDETDYEAEAWNKQWFLLLPMAMIQMTWESLTYVDKENDRSH